MLPELGLARSRSRAAELVAEGRALIDGAQASKAGARVGTGALVELVGDDRFVSRAANKLELGLSEFGIDPTGEVALDVGASTGGFTQVLLERGARTVLAVDVGHDQIVPELREDPRVRVVEGRNARELTAENLAADTGVDEAPSVVVADLSFISLGLVLAPIAACAAQSAQFVFLIKPQFEVGRVRDGVVTDPAQWAEAIRAVLGAAARSGLAARGLEASPIAGGSGNREFLVHFQRDPDPDPTEWETRIAELISAEAPPGFRAAPSTTNEAEEGGR